MADDDVSGASFSSAFAIILSLSRERIAELGCDPIGEDPSAFVDSGGLRRLENEAANAAIARVRQAAYPLIFNLFGCEMPRGKARNLILARLGQDLARIEKELGYSDSSAKLRGQLANGRRQRRKPMPTKTIKK